MKTSLCCVLLRGFVFFPSGSVVKESRNLKYLHSKIKSNSEHSQEKKKQPEKCGFWRNVKKHKASIFKLVVNACSFDAFYSGGNSSSIKLQKQEGFLSYSLPVEWTQWGKKKKNFFKIIYYVFLTRNKFMQLRNVSSDFSYFWFDFWSPVLFLIFSCFWDVLVIVV